MRAFLVVLAATLVAHSGVAAGDAAELTVVGDGSLLEARHHLDVEIRGLIATVVTHQTLLNPGKADVEALYDFSLPHEAVVTGLEVRPARGPSASGLLVAANAAIHAAPDAGVVATVPDLALLRMTAAGEAASRDCPGAPARYELRVYPVRPGGPTTITVRWVMPLVVDGGRVFLTVPDRGDAANLVRETGSVRTVPVAGIRAYRGVRVGGALLRAGSAAVPFQARGGELRVEAEPQITRSGPAVWYETLPIDRRHGAIAVSALSPPAMRRDPIDDEQLLLLIDGSRSVGADGRDTAARAIEAILAAASPQTRVEAVLFDRTARRVLQAWRPVSEVRAQLPAAVRAATGGNGSDLGAALDTAALALAAGTAGARTLVVVVTDGILPVDGDTGLIDRLGGARDAIDVGAIVVVPEQAAAPDLRFGPLADLTNHFGGRVLTLRRSELAARAATLGVELHAATPLTALDAEAGTTRISWQDLPSELPSGGGFVTLGTYHDGAPSAVRLTARAGSRPVSLAAARVATGGAVLALAGVDPEELAAEGARGDDRSGGNSAREICVAAVRSAFRQHRVMAMDRSLVALHGIDAAGRARIALAASGGPFTRVAPPPEKDAGGIAPVVDHVRSEAPEAPTGEVPLATLRAMLTQQLLPRARGCLARALIGGKRVELDLVLELQLARGELMAAAPTHDSTYHPVLTPCLVDAAFELNVPSYRLGAAPDPIVLLRYPVRFRTSEDGQGEVAGDVPMTPTDRRIVVDPTDPLGDLRNRRPRP